jgi:hypothetical protein
VTAFRFVKDAGGARPVPSPAVAAPGEAWRVELADKVELVRQEQKTEHWKTRLLVVILALPNIGRALPYLLGTVGVHIPSW